MDHPAKERNSSARGYEFPAEVCGSNPRNAPSSGLSLFFRENSLKRNRFSFADRNIGFLYQPIHFAGREVGLHLLVPLVIGVRKKLGQQLAVFLWRQPGDRFFDFGHRAHMRIVAYFPANGKDADVGREEVIRGAGFVFRDQ